SSADRSLSVLLSQRPSSSGSPDWLESVTGPLESVPRHDRPTASDGCKRAWSLRCRSTVGAPLANEERTVDPTVAAVDDGGPVEHFTDRREGGRAGSTVISAVGWNRAAAARRRRGAIPGALGLVCAIRPVSGPAALCGTVVRIPISPGLVDAL